MSEARREWAETLKRIRHERWLRGDETCSNVSIARSCGVDEKTVRQWMADQSDEPGVKGKPMPAGALRLLPSQLYGELVDATTASRGRTPKRALLRLREALSDLGGELSREDGGEVVRALVGAQEQITTLMRKAMGG